MPASNKLITTAVLGSPWTGTSTAYSILDVLSSVGRDWEMLHGAPPQSPVFAASLVSLDGQPYTDINGRRISPDAALDDLQEPQLVIVPDLHLDPNAQIPNEFAALGKWIRRAYAKDAMVTSVCSGALLLAAAGLLDGLDATTHWGYSEMLRQRFPDVRLRRERILVPSGDGHRIITAGGSSAWADLLLYLLARLVSAEEARRIAKIYLLEPHTDGQLCYASLTAGRQHEDKLVATAQVWVADNYDQRNPVRAMSEMSGLSERAFLRRFRSATGQSPLDYVQTLRVEEAKHMLETTDKSIEEIAEEIGYSEPSSFRSAFRKRVGLPASAYRKKWRGSAVFRHCRQIEIKADDPHARVF
ncbi:MAG TPA: helix-turn-helix domain-containing protein [Woeseiaceae bacterium]|nr:helix-turn-helix domain-containing protein [Woeseiaceae bacterium]